MTVWYAGRNYKITKCLLLFHCKNSYANALQCYVIRKLPVLFVFYRITVKMYFR